MSTSARPCQTARSRVPASLTAVGAGLMLALSATPAAAMTREACVTAASGSAVPSVQCPGPASPAPIAPVVGGVGQRAPEPVPMPYPLPDPELF
jgi:hypothetical protein